MQHAAHVTDYYREVANSHGWHFNMIFSEWIRHDGSAFRNCYSPSDRDLWRTNDPWAFCEEMRFDTPYVEKDDDYYSEDE